MLTPLADAWTPAAAQVALKATLLLAGAAAASLALRRASASARHLVWTLSIGALLALPLLALALPAWRVPLLPGGSPGPDLVFRAPSPAVAFPPGEGEVAPPPADLLPPPPASAARPLPGDVAGPMLPAWSGGEWLLALWAAGALLVLARLAVGLATLRRLARGAKPVTDEEWCFLYDELAYEMRLRRPVALLRSDAATMPMAWGTLRPVVLLPAEADEWDEGRRRVVLLHELAHVQRLDCLTQTLAQVACALYWMHPGAWWAAARMRAERERACDDRVLGLGARASDYAGHLLEVARRFRAAPLAAGAAVAMARPSQLEGRVLAVLDERAERRLLSRRAVALAAAGVLAVVLPLAAMRPVARAMGIGSEPEGKGMEHGAKPPAGAALAAGHGRHGDEADDTVRADPRVSRGLVAALQDTVVAVRRAAAQALAERGDPATLPALAAATRDPDAEVRRAAVWGLGAMELRDGVPAIAAALRDADAEVRAAAAEALGEMGDASAAPALRQAVEDASADVRRHAVWALAELRDAASFPVVAGALRDPDAEVRATAATALGELKDRRAVEPLGALLRDPSADARKHAAAALGELGDRAAMAPLSAALDDREAEVRATAAWALAELGLAEAPRQLLEMAGREPEPGLRAKAIWALAEIGDRRALPVVREALRHANGDVQRAAIHAVSELKDPEASTLFLELLESENPEVREAAAEALADPR